MAPTPNVFYLDGALCRRIHINRAADTMGIFHYPEGVVKTVSYTYARKNLKQAFTLAQTCKLLNRRPSRLRDLYKLGILPEVQWSYKFGPNKERLIGMHYWSEDDILMAHDFYITQHRGGKRKDGQITNYPPLPSRRELKAKMRQETVLYVKTADGRFVPTYQAEDF